MLLFESWNLSKNINQTNCTLATIPKEIFTGVNKPNDQFMGFFNIYEILFNFKEEADKIRTRLGTNFQNVSESGVNQQISKTIQNVQTFSSSKKGKLKNPKNNIR
jgi:hypothetical protein